MLTSAIDKRHELLILDTGPIRELVLYHAVSEFGFERLRNELRFIKDAESYGRCSEFVGTFSNRLTTSAGVVVELYHWIRATAEHGRSKLWGRVYDEFRNMGMYEEVVRLLVMDASLVVRCGPVDASLLQLARRHRAHNPLILTVDWSFHGECTKSGLKVSHLEEITARKA